MKNITMSREDIVKIYDELDRRMESAKEYFAEHNIRVSDQDIEDEYKARLQGVYGTIMAIVPNENWCEIAKWIFEIETERYGVPMC